MSSKQHLSKEYLEGASRSLGIPLEELTKEIDVFLKFTNPKLVDRSKSPQSKKDTVQQIEFFLKNNHYFLEKVS